MGYRDDREALLHRAEALEREAARLREENAALAAERAALEAERQARAADDESRAREAAERRAELERRAAQPVPAPPPASPPRRRSGRSEAERLANGALAGWTVRVAWILGGPAALAGGMVGMVWLHPTLGFFTLYAAPVLAGAVVFGAGLLAARVAAIIQRRRLATHDLPLDVAAYLAVLGRKHAHKVVTARVAFTTAPPEADRDLIRRVVTGAVETATVAWEDDALVVTSRPLETSVHGKGGVHHRNFPIHRWYRRLERRALRPLARAFPLASVRVS